MNHAAPAEMADRHDQPCTIVTLVKLELAEIGPSATVLPVGMCAEPPPAKLGNFLQCARHRNLAPLRKECGRRERASGHMKSGLMGGKNLYCIASGPFHSDQCGGVSLTASDHHRGLDKHPKLARPDAWRWGRSLLFNPDSD